MVGLAATGTLEYNGYTFDGASAVRVQTTPVYDDADLLVIGERHLINVRAVIADDNTTDIKIEDIRQRLTKAGKLLRFINRGFGRDLIVSGQVGDGTIHADLNAGPKPRMLSWTPIGDVRAVEIEWQVETVIASCDVGQTARKSGIKTINYAMEYAIDEHGDTTRTLRGHYEIVGRRTGRNRLADSADNYRELINIPAIKGFKRTQSWTLSADRMRVEFVIVDTQIPSPNAYPRGATFIQANHRFSFARNRKSGRFKNTISATISAHAGLSGAQAWASFGSLVGSRLDFAKKKKNDLFITAIDIDESLFDRSHRFSVNYQHLNSIDELIGDTGLFQSIDTTWDKWLLSLQAGALHFRGNAKLRHHVASEVLISLCEPFQSHESGQVTNVGTRAPTFVRAKSGSRRQKGVLAPQRGSYSNEQPSSKRSFLRFEHRLQIEIVRTTTRHRIIQDPGTDGGFWETESNKPLPAAFSTGKAEETRLSDAIQEDTAPSYSLMYTGVATRVGFPVPRPKLLKIGDKDLEEVRAEFVFGETGTVLGINTYTMTWSVEAFMAGSPGVVAVPKNWEDQ